MKEKKLRDRLKLLFLGLFENPLWFKEIRGKFRSIRFFWMHFSTVSMMSLAFFLAIAFMASSEENSFEEIGRRLFFFFAVGQFLIVLFIFPAFSCTAINNEKTNHAFDLLITTTLKPWEIFWGKFLSSFSYIYIFLISTLPLLAISFLFGGIHVEYIFWVYFFLFLLSLIVTIYSLYASAVHSSLSKAVSLTYTMVFLGSILLLMGVGFVWNEWLDGGTRTPLQYYQSLSAKEQTNLLMKLFCIGHLYISLSILFFIAGVNRLKPTTANKSTNLRIWFLYFLLGGLIGSYYFCSETKQWTPTSLWLSFIYTQILLGFVCLIPMVWFTLEPIFLPLRLYRQSLKWTSWKMPLRMFWPGALSGFAFAFFFMVLIEIVFSLLLYNALTLENYRGKTTPEVLGLESFWPTTILILILGFTFGQILLFAQFYFPDLRKKTFFLGGLFLFITVVPLIIFFTDYNKWTQEKTLNTDTKLVQASWLNLYYLNPPLILYSSFQDLNYRKTQERGIDFFLSLPWGLYPLHLIGGFFYLNLGILLAFWSLITYGNQKRDYLQQLNKLGGISFTPSSL